MIANQFYTVLFLNFVPVVLLMAHQGYRFRLSRNLIAKYFVFSENRFLFGQDNF